MDAQRGTKRKSYDMMNAFVTAAQASVVSSSTPSPSSQEQPSRRRRRRTSSSESKKRNMDSFLEELKNKHDRGEEETNSYLSLSSTGSYDDGDPTTTNLHVGNLAPTVTENVLAEMFQKYGPLHSLKIFWPRRDEGRRHVRRVVSDGI